MSSSSTSTRIPSDTSRIGAATSLVRAAVITSHLGADEWTSVVGVLIAVHSGSDKVPVDLQQHGKINQLSVELDSSERPVGQQLGRREDPTLVASSMVIEGNFDEHSYPLVVRLDGSTAALWLDANSFSTAVRERLAIHFEILATTDEVVGAIDLPVVTSPQSRGAVPGSQLARSDPEWGSCVISRFLEVVRVAPESVALKFEDESMTYRELAEWVGGVVDELRNVVNAGAQVGILAEHGIEPIVGMLACLASGASYIPLDPRMPNGRLQRVVQQSRPSVVLCSPDLADRADLLFAGEPTIVLKRSAGDLAPPPETAEKNPSAYVLFTSGSTGTPKGVMQSVRSIMIHARNYRDSIALTAGDVVPLLASFAFDAAVMDIYGGLLSGATVHVIDPMQPADSLRESLELAPPAILHGTPTLIRHLLDGVHGPWDALIHVRAVVFGGERVLAADVERVRLALPNVYVVNGLGPSECTVAVQHVISPTEPVKSGDIPIGLAVPGVTVELVDSHGRPASIAGDLVFTSAAVAIGYQNEAELTSQRFTSRNGRRSFRTGDRAWVRPDGTLMFMGRGDRQFKIRGQRVDPNEIESVLREHPGVDQAFVRLDADGELTAFLVPASSAPLNPDDVRRTARAALPPVAVPSRMAIVHELPVGYTGKIDLQALAADPVTPTLTPASSNAAFPESSGQPDSVSNRAPLTFGQLSVVRSLRGNISTASANVSRVVHLSSPTAPQHVKRAVEKLVDRHASLRTTFELSEKLELVQLTNEFKTAPLRMVEIAEDTRATRAAVVATLEAEAYDVEREPGWRAAAVTSGGLVVAIALSLHHLLADAWALAVIEDDLVELLHDPNMVLAGPTITPAALARRQRGPEWAPNRELFEDHWGPMFDDPQRFPSAGHTEAGPRTVIRAALEFDHSALDVMAHRWGVFPSTVLTAVAIVSWSSVSSPLNPSFFAATVMNAGRLDADTQQLVASQNQVVPVTVERRDGEPFAEMTRRLQESLVGAVLAGVYDIDEVCERAGVEEMGHLLDYWVNILEEKGSGSLDSAECATTPSIVNAPHKSWPYFYYKIRVGQRIYVDLAVPPWSASTETLQRMMRGWDRALELLNHDAATTVDDVARCFQPINRTPDESS